MPRNVPGGGARHAALDAERTSTENREVEGHCRHVPGLWDMVSLGLQGAEYNRTGEGQGGHGRRTSAQAAAECRALNTLCTVVGTQDFVFPTSGPIEKHSCSEAVAYSKKCCF